MSKNKNHHQRRRRPRNRMWLFHAILLLERVAYYVERFLSLFDRE